MTNGIHVLIFVFNNSTLGSFKEVQICSQFQPFLDKRCIFSFLNFIIETIFIWWYGTDEFQLLHSEWTIALHCHCVYTLYWNVKNSPHLGFSNSLFSTDSVLISLSSAEVWPQQGCGYILLTHNWNIHTFHYLMLSSAPFAASPMNIPNLSAGGKP